MEPPGEKLTPFEEQCMTRMMSFLKVSDPSVKETAKRITAAGIQLPTLVAQFLKTTLTQDWTPDDIEKHKKQKHYVPIDLGTFQRVTYLELIAYKPVVQEANRILFDLPLIPFPLQTPLFLRNLVDYPFLAFCDALDITTTYLYLLCYLSYQPNCVRFFPAVIDHLSEVFGKPQFDERLKKLTTENYWTPINVNEATTLEEELHQLNKDEKNREIFKKQAMEKLPKHYKFHKQPPWITSQNCLETVWGIMLSHLRGVITNLITQLSAKKTGVKNEVHTLLETSMVSVLQQHSHPTKPSDIVKKQCSHQIEDMKTKFYNEGLLLIKQTTIYLCRVLELAIIALLTTAWNCPQVPWTYKEGETYYLSHLYDPTLEQQMNEEERSKLDKILEQNNKMVLTAWGGMNETDITNSTTDNKIAWIEIILKRFAEYLKNS